MKKRMRLKYTVHTRGTDQGKEEEGDIFVSLHTSLGAHLRLVVYRFVLRLFKDQIVGMYLACERGFRNRRLCMSIYVYYYYYWR